MVQRQSEAVNFLGQQEAARVSQNAPGAARIQGGTTGTKKFQFDDGTAPKEVNVHFVQTEKIFIGTDPELNNKKAYMLDE